MPLDVTKKHIDAFLSYGFKIAFPYNNDLNLWSRLKPYKKTIAEIYAGLHPDVFPSLRVWKSKETAEEHIEHLKFLFDNAAKAGIALNIILNSHPTRPFDPSRILRALDEFAEIGEVRATLSDIQWATFLRGERPNLHMEVSTTAGVYDQYNAMMWRDLVGVQTIILTQSINKNARKIKQIKRLGLPVKLVLNDVCTTDCPARIAHSILHANHEDVKQMELADKRHLIFCRHIKNEIPVWHMIKKEVLPFQLPRYEGLVDIFKLCDRRNDTNTNIDLLTRYLRMKEDVHPTLNYREPMQSFDQLSQCERICAECSWCEEHVEVLKPRSDIMPFREDIWESYKNILVAGSMTPSKKTEISPSEQISAKLSVHSEEAHNDSLTLERLAEVKETEKERQEKELADKREKEEAKQQSFEIGWEAVKQIKVALEKERNLNGLRLLKNVMTLFRPYLTESASLVDGFRFVRLTRPFAGALAIEWEHKESKKVFSFALMDASHPGKAAIANEQLKLSFLEGEAEEIKQFEPALWQLLNRR